MNGLNEPSNSPIWLFLSTFDELVLGTHYHNSILSTMVCPFLSL